MARVPRKQHHRSMPSLRRCQCPFKCLMMTHPQRQPQAASARCEQVQHVCAAVLSIADMRLQGRTCIQDLRCFHASYNLHMCIKRHMSASIDTTLLTLGWCAVTPAPLSAY